MNILTKLGVVLLSGGMDSATLAFSVKKENYDLAALTLDYGQRHRRELESAARIAGALKIKHKIIDVSFFKDLAWYSALTSPEKFDVPERAAEAPAGNIPVTYVPLRNTFFIVLAAAYLESEILRLLKSGAPAAAIEAAVFLGANAVDFSGYPDCTPQYLKKMQAAVRAGSQAGSEYRIPLRIEAPFKDMSKAEIVQMGMKLGVPFEDTWSCYRAGGSPCLKCDSCRLRKKGFAEAGFEDPLLEG